MRMVHVAITWVLVLAPERIVAQEAEEKPLRPATTTAARGVDEVVDDERLLETIEGRCAQLRRENALRSIDALREGADGRRFEFVPAAVASSPLALPDLRERLLQSVCVVGQYYRCPDCDGWHASASTGFAVGEGGLVATCFHVLEPDPEEAEDGTPDAPQPCLFVADWSGRVHPVSEVVAADRGADVAILRCGATELRPLPLRPAARAGERVFCLSNPDHWFAVFTEGLVARRYVVRGGAPGSGTDAAGPAHALDLQGPTRTFLQVTCDFAGGSSGAPVVDAAGNVLGMAQSTSTLSTAVPGTEFVDVQMVARTAVPAEALLQLGRR